MQIVTDVIEGWIREYPEQWLWLHRRWRDKGDFKTRLRLYREGKLTSQSENQLPSSR